MFAKMQPMYILNDRKTNDMSHICIIPPPLKVTYSLIPFIVDCTGKGSLATHAFFEEQAMVTIVALFNAALKGSIARHAFPQLMRIQERE